VRVRIQFPPAASQERTAAHIRRQHRIDQIIVECFEVCVRHHPREPGGIDQDIGAAELVGDRGRNPTDLRGIRALR
jgi:hypothetical protein